MWSFLSKHHWLWVWVLFLIHKCTHAHTYTHISLDIWPSGVLSCSISRAQLCNPIDWSPPDSSVHGIFQARMLEWVAISSSRGSSWPRDGAHVSCVSCTDRQYHQECQDISLELEYSRAKRPAYGFREIWYSMDFQKKMGEEFTSQKDTVSWSTEALPAEYITIADMTASLLAYSLCQWG